MATFNGIELGKRALQIQKISLDTTGHNIANANTEGYSRQRTVHSTTDPYTAPGFNGPAGAGQIGTGVKIEQITRMKDDFISYRLNNETQNMGAWQARKDNLSQIEMIFNEPSETGIRNLLDKFWESWQDLNDYPDSQGVRSAVKEQAQTLIDAFHHTHKQLTELRGDINGDIALNKDKVNTLGEKIALLNRRIVSVEGDPAKNANDLRDKRDLLVKQLSEFINVQAREDSRGNLNLSIGGTAFVSGDNFNKIDLQKDGDGMNQLVWNHTNDVVTVESGKIKGSLDVRDRDIPDYIVKLDNLAGSIVTEVNSLHNDASNPNTYDLNGDPGGDFFDAGSITADTISLDTAIADVTDGLNKIAAASVDAVGDGGNALAIAQLKDGLTMAGGNSTFNDYFTSVISGLGVEAEKANTMYGNQEVLVNSLENKQNSISGVSLDEEMSNLVKYQHAYNAAAKVIAKTDEMLNTLINGMI